MEQIDILNVILNGGSAAILLFLLMRLEKRFDDLLSRVLRILEHLADINGIDERDLK